MLVVEALLVSYSKFWKGGTIIIKGHGFMLITTLSIFVPEPITLLFACFFLIVHECVVCFIVRVLHVVS